MLLKEKAAWKKFERRVQSRLVGAAGLDERSELSLSKDLESNPCGF